MEQVRVRAGDGFLAAVGLIAAVAGLYATIVADRAGQLLSTAGVAFLVAATVVLLKALRFGGVPKWAPTPYAVLWTAVAVATLLLLILLPGKLLQFALESLRD